MRRLLQTVTKVPPPVMLTSETPDVALVSAALHDRAAFDHLFDRYWDPIFKFCFHALGDWHSAEDAAADVFLKALASLSTFDPSHPGNSFQAWLFGIARHVVKSNFRYASRHPQDSMHSDFDFVDRGRSVEEIVTTGESQEQLRTLLNQLPPEQRELLELRLAGLTAVEISQVTGRSHDAIRKAQSRTIATLRKNLEELEQTTEVNHHE